MDYTYKGQLFGLAKSYAQTEPLHPPDPIMHAHAYVVSVEDAGACVQQHLRCLTMPFMTGKKQGGALALQKRPQILSNRQRLHSLTAVLALTSAPAFKILSTMSTWPLQLAKWSGVQPFYSSSMHE